ncbi:bifunctional metallophosphatase/5'-nucleotidase [Amphibacillus xylanus]|uniref:Putative phosphatase n=1 Tax=Amphibacillus xylanus (strain ATCC 51415 / DSM 6626 / JCM 7361 / LMG 17667 / NBRC 15112 / Ep01) TaxID=698758 RepID=K0J6X4_AMPXN|nr:bifunctional UDP-sugar hydrolase/5'-nucleotidase [Amphibacillus xylanus]BAM46948.1 putative phosphatase [Amphibacillus xylanus NBRC 15112]
MREELYFYYTSDLHSYFDNWPKIMTFLKKKIALRVNKQQDYFLLDNGDHLDRVNPITEALKGKGNVELLNLANYDIINLGNNEGITLTKAELSSLYDQASFNVACANLESQTNDSPDWLKPYHILVTASGIKIAVIGLTAPFNDFYHPLGWRANDPYETLDKYIDRLKEESDLIILLSHLGVNPDRKIAEQFPEIDVIIGGHTHHLFKTEERHHQAILTGVGKSGFYVGELALTWDHQEKRLIKKHAIAHPIKDELPDPQVLELLKRQEIESERMLQKEVTRLPLPLKVDWYEETLLIKHLTKTLKEWTNADVAMLNAGLLLNGFKQGLVTEYDVHRNCPHPINPCVVVVTGQELIEIVRAGLAEEYQRIRVKGYGFRGEVMGKLVYAGLDCHRDPVSGGQDLCDHLTINGHSLVLDKTYRLATADMFTFEHLSPFIAQAKSKQFFLPEFMRDLLRQTLRQLA